MSPQTRDSGRSSSGLSAGPDRGAKAGPAVEKGKKRGVRRPSQERPGSTGPGRNKGRRGGAAPASGHARERSGSTGGGRPDSEAEAAVTVRNAFGLHMRPAGEIVKLASSFPCDIVLKARGQEVGAMNIIGLIALEVQCGDEVLVHAKGERAAEAVAALQELMASLPEFDQEQLVLQKKAASPGRPPAAPERAGPRKVETNRGSDGAARKAGGRRSPRTQGGADGGKRSGRRGRKQGGS